MKLFGSSGGKHSRKPAPVPKPEEAESIVLEEAEARPVPAPPDMSDGGDRGVSVQFETVEPPPLPREIETAAFRSEDASELAAAEQPSHRFRTGFVIYVCVFLIVIFAALLLLWVRMDIYELSRPYRAMETWTSGMICWWEKGSMKGISNPCRWMTSPMIKSWIPTRTRRLRTGSVSAVKPC